ncbi:MAG: hypothetical protein II969_05010 [Anaerolineaceae bacterium]|nr:hypothetical protein [Anaerolineaceae bacterium]
MKNKLKTFLLLYLFLLFPCGVSAQKNLDPILVDQPSPYVFECKNDIFLEISTQAVVGNVVAQRVAKFTYMSMTVKVLYLAEQEMQGLDKESFTLVHTSEDGSKTKYPMNFAISMIATRNKANHVSFGQTLKLPTYWTFDLVFDIDTLDKKNWELVFTPMPRGGGEAYCEIVVPFTAR